MNIDCLILTILLIDHWIVWLIWGFRYWLLIYFIHAIGNLIDQCWSLIDFWLISIDALIALCFQACIHVWSAETLETLYTAGEGYFEKAVLCLNFCKQEVRTWKYIICGLLSKPSSSLNCCQISPPCLHIKNPLVPSCSSNVPHLIVFLFRFLQKANNTHTTPTLPLAPT